MRWNILLLSCLGGILLLQCRNPDPQLQQRAGSPQHTPGAVQLSSENPYPSIGAIPAPAGFLRIADTANHFAAWLRAIPLKKNRTVYLYNGLPKANQDAQFAVLDVSVGNQDLQQCADAVMRLRAEYLYANHAADHINFCTDQGTRLDFGEWQRGKRFSLQHNRLVSYQLADDHIRNDRGSFDGYLQTVFAYCGTLSLEKQLKPVPRFRDMKIGDVLIRGGSPGHAMLVADMAADPAGNKIFILVQSYMPAQDIHIVKNYNSSSRIRGNEAVSGTGPWFEIKDGDRIQPVQTPEWLFYTDQLRTWPEE